jgi:hypothetical protein
VPSFADQPSETPRSADDGQDSGFATWNTPEVAETPGKSWDAPPPQNTAVPVNEEMIASLVGEPEPPIELAAPAPEPVAEPLDIPTWAAAPTAPQRQSSSGTSIDQLLKLVRDLEYGLVELADIPAPPEQSAPEAVSDPRLLENALDDLADEDELAPLRAAVASAQERPRDVDVMLDLVLRADAIAAVLTERDQLKAAIELALGNANQVAAPDSSDATDSPEAEAPSETDGSDDDDTSSDDAPDAHEAGEEAEHEAQAI